MKVVVIGGSGIAGRATVSALAAAGHEPLAISRSTGVDLVSGRGLREALAGAGAVVDVTNTDVTKRKPAERFFETTTGNLVQVAGEVGVPHLVCLSIVGVDRVPYGYYQGKLRQEQVLTESEVPTSVLRATQFHEFAGQFLDRASGRFVIVPKWAVEPIAVREVAAALASIAAGEPAGRIEIAGPSIENMADLVRRVAQARADGRRIIELRVPGAAGKALASGGNTNTAAELRGVETFTDWLAARVDAGGL